MQTPGNIAETDCRNKTGKVKLYTRAWYAPSGADYYITDNKEDKYKYLKPIQFNSILFI